jgi:PGF-CTERM protein
MPLDIKVGTKKVSSVAVGTNITIDTEGMNLFPKDQVDLIIMGPDGQIKYDTVNEQKFTDITVADLGTNYGSDNLETAGWTIGAYVFKVKTDEENACGLEAESDTKGLVIIKGAVSIEAATTAAVELDVVKLVVSGVSNDPITVTGDSKNVIFKTGVDDTPLLSYTEQGYPYFNTYIDDDGIRRYAVEFDDTGSYTIRVTVTEGDRKDDYDTVDITVSEKEVVFDLPSTVVIGDTIHIRGTATSGTYVSVYVDDVLYRKLDNTVIQHGEFDEEVKTTDIGMNVPGSVRLKAWIDCRALCGDCLVSTGEDATANMPTKSADGEEAILLTTPTLKAELSQDVVATEDDFKVFGTAQGSTQVTILSVPPKGGGGRSLSGTGRGLSQDAASVSTTDYTYTKKITVQKDADTGYYDEYVLSSGMDGYWGMTGESSLEAAFEKKYGITDLSGPSIATKTQAELQDILEDMIYAAGADDLMVKLKLKVETPFVTVHPIPDVTAPAPLVVGGISNRKDGYAIVITCKGDITELPPETAMLENGTFRVTLDTRDAVTGTYIVKADDGDGNVDETETFIAGIGVRKAEAAVEEAVETLEEAAAAAAKELEKKIEEEAAAAAQAEVERLAKEAAEKLAEKAAEATPEPPGFEAIFAIAGLLAVAYLVHRRKH